MTKFPYQQRRLATGYLLASASALLVLISLVSSERGGFEQTGRPPANLEPAGPPALVSDPGRGTVAGEMQSPALPEGSPHRRDFVLLADRSAALNEREKAALRLAARPTVELRELLVAILNDETEDPRLRATAARVLAQIGALQARELAARLLEEQHGSLLARGAVRGIAQTGDPGSALFLSDLLLDENISDLVRMEAAAGLAISDSPHGFQALLRASYSDLHDNPMEAVLHEVLRGLAREHFADATGFLDGLLDHPDIDAESKIAALEALIHASGDEVVAILLKHAVSPDAEIREAAIWALAGHADRAQAYESLAGILEKEKAPWVRANLYDALRLQEAVDVDLFWNLVMSETVVPTRLAGFNLIADHLPGGALARFEAEVVPQLLDIASADPSLSNRISAIIALGRASDSEAAASALLLLQEGSPDAETRRAIELALQQ